MRNLVVHNSGMRDAAFQSRYKIGAGEISLSFGSCAAIISDLIDAAKYLNQSLATYSQTHKDSNNFASVYVVRFQNI